MEVDNTMTLFPREQTTHSIIVHAHNYLPAFLVQPNPSGSINNSGRRGRASASDRGSYPFAKWPEKREKIGETAGPLREKSMEERKKREQIPKKDKPDDDIDR